MNNSEKARIYLTLYRNMIIDDIINNLTLDAVRQPTCDENIDTLLCINDKHIKNLVEQKMANECHDIDYLRFRKLRQLQLG